jgi:hypothetical protein
MDTNTVERAIRPLVLNRKNALFAGHDRGAKNWAVVASLIESCKLYGVNPETSRRRAGKARPGMVECPPRRTHAVGMGPRSSGRHPNRRLTPNPLTGKINRKSGDPEAPLTTKPYHPWTNGQAERMNRTVPPHSGTTHLER